MQNTERTAQCVLCGADFTSTHCQQRFCSSKCRRRNTYLTEYTPRRYTKTCRWCGKSFPSRNRAQQSCSRECVNRWNAHTHSDRNAARVRAWAAANPERFARRMAEARARRRALLAAAPTSAVTDRDLRRQRDRQCGCCAYCGEAKPLTLEHVVPLARGGSHSIGNLLWVCRSCNCSKQQRLLVEWKVIRQRASRTAVA